jgi:CHAD domain-containing protein
MTDDDESRLTAEMPFKQAMRSLIAPRFHAVWKAIPDALDESNPDGVHDVRVASRRLRAAMDVGADCFPKSWFRPLHQAAKEITSALGEVRDRDVLLEFLADERRSAPASDAPGVDRLISRVERERGQARAKMIRFLESVEDRKIEKVASRRFGEGAKEANSEGADK